MNNDVDIARAAKLIARGEALLAEASDILTPIVRDFLASQPSEDECRAFIRKLPRSFERTELATYVNKRAQGAR